jgi:hypothetical protein
MNENLENLRICPHFKKCNQNLCILDFELSLRSGGVADRCRWMREARRTKINGRQFISGGAIAPNGILKFVPQSNLKRLNESSRKAWLELKFVKMEIVSGKKRIKNTEKLQESFRETSG